MFLLIDVVATLNVTNFKLLVSTRTRKQLAHLVLDIFLGDVVDLSNSSQSLCFPRHLLGTTIEDNISVKLPLSLQLSELVQSRRKEYIFSELVTRDNMLNEKGEIGRWHLLSIQGGTSGKGKVLSSSEKLRRKMKRIENVIVPSWGQ